MGDQPYQSPATGSYFARRTPIVPVSSADIYAQASPYFQLPSWFRGYPGQAPQTYLTEESNRRLQEEYERQKFMQSGAAVVPGGTILHKGFYDLLALSQPVVQTVSRFWTGARDEQLLAGQPYEQLPTGGPSPRVVETLPPVPPTTPKKSRRVSKDMISKPTGFMYVLSDH